MVCCGQLMSVRFPTNATVDDKQTLIQELVNQCGVRMAFCGGDLPQNPPNDPVKLFLNNPKQCTVLCPDGSPFVYTVVAGTFAATTQAEADSNAASYACVQASLRRVCLGSIPSCTCVGVAYSATIATSGGIAPFVWSIASGSLPPGVGLSQIGVISGTPTTPGTYAFSVRVTEPDGSNVVKSYSLACIKITDTSLPDYTVGTPYSHQLEIAGGSGNYAVKLDSGVLPDGLIMSVTGLINGTPTGANAGTMPLVFDVIDTTCQAVTSAFFSPRVSLIGHSTTTIATLLGYSEYVASTPPKKYHKLSWSGTSEQTTTTIDGQPVSDAKYVYSGTGEIDTHGVQVSNYRKDFYSPCPASNFMPLINSIPNFGIIVLKGYCWTSDPNSCPTCQYPPVFKQNEAQNMLFDIPQQIIQAGNFTSTATGITCNSGAGGLLSVQSGGPGGVNGVPQTTFNGLTGAWLLFNAGSNYTSLLTDEYTDAEALTNAQIINSNGLTAENLPRTTGFVSRWTTVAYDLNFTNLVVGQSYVAQVSFLNQNPSGISTKAYGFVATASTKTIHDTIATPPNGGSITVRNPTVAFSP